MKKKGKFHFWEVKNCKYMALVQIKWFKTPAYRFSVIYFGSLFNVKILNV